MSPLSTAAANALMAAARAPGHADPGEVGLGQGRGIGERVGEPEVLEARHPPPGPLDDPRRDRARAAHAHLLADDGAHPGLVGVPGARHPQPGSCSPRPRANSGSSAEPRVGVRRIAVEGEDLPGSLHDVDEPADVGQVGAEPEVARSSPAAQLEHAREARRPRSCAGRCRRPRARRRRSPGWRSSRAARPSRARRGTGAAGRARRRPGARSPRRRRARSSVGGAWNTCWLARLSCRRLPKPLAHAMSVTDRSVSSRSRRAKWVRWLRASWSGVVPTCSTKSRRRWRTDTPSGRRQVGLGASVERALGDQVHRPAHQLGPGGDVGRLAVGAAPEARPEAGGLRLGGRPVGHDVRRAAGAPSTTARSRCRWW